MPETLLLFEKARKSVNVMSFPLFFAAGFLFSPA
jgi:hypothetical protein